MSEEPHSHDDTGEDENGPPRTTFFTNQQELDETGKLGERLATTSFRTRRGLAMTVKGVVLLMLLFALWVFWEFMKNSFLVGVIALAVIFPILWIHVFHLLFRELRMDGYRESSIYEKGIGYPDFTPPREWWNRELGPAPYAEIGIPYEAITGIRRVYRTRRSGKCLAHILFLAQGSNGEWSFKFRPEPGEELLELVEPYLGERLGELVEEKVV